MDFKLEILTPVNIASGEVLSQFSDYVYDQGWVYYLDHDILFGELFNKPQGEKLIDEFVTIIQKQAGGNLSNRYNLKSFLEHASLDYKKYALKKVPVSEEIKEQLQLQVKSGGKPYIPGSSLKGAVRTAIISHLFSVEDEPEILKTKGYIGQNYLGKYDQDLLKYLLVSDTGPFEEGDLGIARFYKYNLKNGKTDIPVIKEVINPGSATNFTIKTMGKKGVVGEKLAFLYEGREASLLPVINEYARNNIAQELKLLKKGSKDEVKELIHFYTELLHSVENADTTKEAYLRIGSGKTFYDNTIAQKLSEKSLQQIITKNFKNANPNFFPATMTVIMTRGVKELPGWIRISKQ